MRVVVIVVAALVILGLAAFGVVSAQKMAGRSGCCAGTRRRRALRPPPPQAPVSQPVSQVAQASCRAVRAPIAAPTDAAGARPTPPPAPPRRARRTANHPGTAAPHAGSAPAANRKRKPAPTATNIPPCDKPGGMGVARIVEIDTTGGPGFGFEHFKQYDFLRDKEIVLTFDDGPWPGNTPAVLKALTDQCLKATFFEIGEHATWHPEITKTGGRRRHDGRQPHLVAQGSGEKSVRQGTSSRPSRKSRWASAPCIWRPPARRSRRSSAFPTCSSRRSCSTYLGSAQHRDLLDRYRLASISRCTSPSR